MLIVRDVFQARYGRGGDLVALMKEAQAQWPAHYADRILTDASGSFFTVVAETKVDSLAAWEGRQAEVLGLSGFADWFERMTDLVENGRREFYNVEA